MDLPIKINRKKKLLVLVFLFALFISFALQTPTTKAAECKCANNSCVGSGEFTSCEYVAGAPGSAGSAEECQQNCKTGGYDFFSYNSVPYVSVSASSAIVAKTQQEASGDAGCSLGQWGSHPINCFLLAVLRFVARMLAVACVLFKIVVDGNNLQKIMNNPGIYEAWIIVRDTLNASFIMVLLFSAFCTVFQVSKYNYKNILFHLVLMALLVNFSYPIARVVIDFSNSMMYYLLNSDLFTGIGGTGVMSKYMEDSAIGYIVRPNNGVSADTSYLIAAIFFLFILTITILCIGILLLIRAIVLAVLIIFSSVGFVGTIVPFLSSLANKFWDNLFKYAFFGPAMVFMIYVAIKMMSYMGDVQNSFGGTSAGMTSDSNVVAAMAYFAIPIVILWVGIGTAQNMSIIGASTVRKGGLSLGKRLTGLSYLQRQAKLFSKKREARQSEIDKKSMGGKLGDKANLWQDRAIRAFGPPIMRGRAKDRLRNMRNAENRERIKSGAEKQSGVGTINIVTNMTNSITNPPQTRSGKIDAAAQAREALSRGNELEREVNAQGASGGLNNFITAQIRAGNLAAGTTWTGATADQIRALYYSEIRRVIRNGENA